MTRPPSAIDQRVGSHSLCLYVCVAVWMGVGGWLGKGDREGRECLTTRFKLGVCWEL